MSDLGLTFGQWLRLARRRAGFTNIWSWAKEVKISEKWAGEIEQGKAMPTFEVLGRFISVAGLDRDVAYFRCGLIPRDLAELAIPDEAIQAALTKLREGQA